MNNKTIKKPQSKQKERNNKNKGQKSMNLRPKKPYKNSTKQKADSLKKQRRLICPWQI
jgi:hypothetical protein